MGMGDGRVFELGSKEVALEVIHRDERDAPHPAERLGRRESDEQRAYESGTRGHRNGLDTRIGDG